MSGPFNVSRPLLRWHGGKWLLAPWIIDHFPSHRVYVEPFGGAASVLLRKPPAYGEVYNDLDEGVVNLMRVLRDGRASILTEQLRFTPFSRVEFNRSYEPTDDTLEAARRLVVRSFMGFGSDGHNSAYRTGFRSASNRSGTTPAHDWANHWPALLDIADRLAGVVVECLPAADVMRQHDAPDTLHYVDPPYLPETRSSKTGGGLRHRQYVHEMTADDHVQLLEALQSLTGMVVLSGYPSRTYDDTLKDWLRIERTALADGARSRIEVLWLNPAAVAAQPQARLFA